ncbi:MAG: AhpC/TSA family protein [Chitinophagales bacterium]|nr:AhpC/TSA family protein [Chitinophagales bacterium]
MLHWLALLFLFGFSFCSAQSHCTVLGHATGFADSTLLLLSDASSSQVIDSAYILNGKFTLKSPVADKALEVVLSTVDHRDYKFFWMESNTTLTFKGEKGKFKNAAVTGAKTQNEANLLENSINPVKDKRDSLYQLFYADTTAKARDLLYPKFKELDKQEEAVYQSFIREYSGSLVSANVLNIYKTTWAFDTVKVLFTLLSPENKQSEYGKQTAAFIAVYKNVKAGDRYADFTLPDTAGKKISLSDFKGKVVLVEFWASWCYGCIQTNPALVKVYNEFSPKGFEVIGVSLDKDRASWIKAIQKDSLSFTNLSDLKGDQNTAALIYGISAIPDNILIDRNGIVIARNLTAKELTNRLRQLCN